MTDNDIERGITDNASAVFEIKNQIYHISKTGSIIIFSTPVTQRELLISKVKLYMYDRQPSIYNGECYFTTEMPLNIVVEKGMADLFFLQNGWPCVFRLVNAAEFRRNITKTYTQNEFGALLPWCKEHVTRKEEYLEYVC